KGMTESQAQAALNKKNLTYAGHTAKYSSTVKKGLVVSQTVPAGTEVVAGTNVEVVLSKGPHSTLLTVPQCVGQQQNDVLPDLRLDGFQNIVVDTIASSQPAGVVVKQMPTAGTKIHPTEQLVLYVSKGGGGGGLLTVPVCVGEQKNDVLPDLRLDGFNNIRAEEVESGKPAGTIVKQIPKAGVKIHPDDPLILYISVG
ncbi:MAG: PASTA domain-containing protein, partial [Actinobacteria bacterium]|nr:PASTA domain-containing protein [Actinomycetota bacterium]